MGGYVEACGWRVGASWPGAVGRRDGRSVGFGLSGGRVGASRVDAAVVGATDGFFDGEKVGVRLRRG
jgi:hypothetical protein